MTVNLNDLKVGNSVRFKNGQVAKVVDIKDKDELSVRLFFDKKVARNVGDSPSDYGFNWWYKTQTGECNGCTNHITEIIKTIDLNDLKVGDSVRFTNGQIAKVVDIKEKDETSLRLYFDKKVACNTGQSTTTGDGWRYKRNGEIIGLTNHIVEIIMTVDLNDLKIGDTVRFTNGQVVKVVDIKENNGISVRLYFDKKVPNNNYGYAIYNDNWYYKIKTGECSGCTNHIVEIIKKGETKMEVDLKTLEIGDSVRFTNGQVAKVVDIKVENKDKPRLYFNKEVACDTKENSPIYTRCWNYRYDGEIVGCTNHIVEIIKKGEKTMNKKKIEKSLEWHKRKVAELEEALKQPDNKRWFPKKEEKYYGIRDGKVRDCFNYNEECTEGMYSVNTVFKTEKEAEKELARRKAETELLDMYDWTPDCDRMWVIFHDKNTSHFDVDYYFSRQHAPYNFASEESARKAIDTLGEEKLKLIFRI